MDLDGLTRPSDDPTPPAGGPTSPAGEPTEAIERHCYAGESVVEAVPFSGGTVGVTTHRVLALTPGGEGPTLQSVDRPNVASIELSNGGEAAHGARALRYGVYALALAGGSFLVDFGGVTAVDPPAGTGAGPVIQLAVSMTGMLTLVDDVLRYAGLGVLVVALCFAALYGYSRDSYLAVAVAGGDAVRVPANTSESAAADRLQVALENASTERLVTETASTASVEKASNPSDG